MHISDIVAGQNPWWGVPASCSLHVPIFKRDVFETLLKGIQAPEPKRAQVLLGPRQVGKTTLLLQIANLLIEGGWPAQNVLYFDFKDERFDHTHGVRDVVGVLPAGAQEDHPRLLLLDEITQAPRWDAALKQLVDEKRRVPGRLRNRILVTDSAAAVMGKGATDFLQGRIDRIQIHGFTFLETLRIQGRLDEFGSPIEEEREIHLRLSGAFERYLERGGLPEHVWEERVERVWKRIRSDIVGGAIARDLARGSSIDVDRVVTVFRYLVQQSGAPFEPKNLARRFEDGGGKGPDARTVQRWLGLLEQACLIETLPPWSPGLSRNKHRATRALTARKKVYAEDHGFIPAFSPYPFPLKSPEVRGQIFETVVFAQLRALRDEREEDFDLYYFREKDRTEIDFVLVFEQGCLGIDVTAGKSPQKKQKSVSQACKRAGLDYALVIHGGLLQPTQSESWATSSLESFLLDPNTLLEQCLTWIRKSR